MPVTVTIRCNWQSVSVGFFVGEDVLRFRSDNRTAISSFLSLLIGTEASQNHNQKTLPLSESEPNTTVLVIKKWKRLRFGQQGYWHYCNGTHANRNYNRPVACVCFEHVSLIACPFVCTAYVRCYGSMKGSYFTFRSQTSVTTVRRRWWADLCTHNVLNAHPKFRCASISWKIKKRPRDEQMLLGMVRFASYVLNTQHLKNWSHIWRGKFSMEVVIDFVHCCFLHTGYTTSLCSLLVCPVSGFSSEPSTSSSSSSSRQTLLLCYACGFWNFTFSIIGPFVSLPWCNSSNSRIGKMVGSTRQPFSAIR